MGITCCKDCSERHLGCHDKCEKYLKQKADWEKQKEWMKANKTHVVSNWDFDEIAFIDAKHHKRHTDF